MLYRNLFSSSCVVSAGLVLCGPAVAGHDALVKTYASFMKPGDKDVDTLTNSRMIGDVAL